MEKECPLCMGSGVWKGMTCSPCAGSGQIDWAGKGYQLNKNPN